MKITALIGATLLLLGGVVVSGLVLGWGAGAIAGGCMIVLSSAGGLAFTRWRVAKATGLEKALREQGKSAGAPEKREEQAQLQLQFERAVHSLKTSKLGRSQGGSDALYALPWYMLVGPPGAGKTTVIANSGLEFPFGTDRIRGVGGTRNCDWFFARSAIFLDTAGRYAVEDEDHEEWLGFLKLLKKHRKHEPINGVLVCMDLAELADAPPAQSEWHAARLRARLDELVLTLGVRFPVYLVFTKADLVQGFVESFEDLSLKERTQVWGATIPVGVGAHGGAGEDVIGAFDAGMDRLLASLKDHRLTRLSHAMKREERHRAFVFPLEMEKLRARLHPFVARLVQHNPYHENPGFRGFYFTSGTQEGAALDRVIQAVARQFDLPPPPPERAADVEAKAYFIRDLFTDVVVPDRHLATGTRRAAWRKGASRYAAGVAGGLATLLVLGAIVLGAARSHARMGRLETAAVAAAPARFDGRAAPADAFGRLDALRAQIVATEAQSGAGTLGLTRRGRVAARARTLYFRKMTPFVETYLYREVERSLGRAASGGEGDGGGARAGRPREALRAYLLMGRESARLEDPAERAALRATLLAVLAARYPFHLLRADDREVLQPLIERQVAFYADELGRPGAPALATNDALVRRVRALPDEPPSARVLLSRIEAEVPGAFPALSVRDLAGARPAEVFADSASVPGFYTRAAWDGYVADAIAEAAVNPRLNDWVMGTADRELPPEMRDPSTLAAELRRLYAADHAAAWWRFLGRVRYAPSPSLAAASDRLTRLGNAVESPLLLLLQGVAKQGRLDASAAGGAPEGFFKRMGRKLGLGDEPAATEPTPGGGSVVARRLSAVQALVAEGEDGAAPEALGKVLEKYADAAFSVGALAETGFEGGAANDVDLAGALREVQRALPDVDPGLRRTLFEQPLSFAGGAVAGAVAGATEGALTDAWKDQIQGAFARDIAPFYPFNPGGPDLPLDVFRSFFNPTDGTFSAFYAERIEPIMSRRDFVPRGGRLSAQSVEAMRRLDAIQTAFFTPSGDLGLTIRVRPEPPASAVPVGQLVLAVDGQEFAYDMGAASYVPVAWPGPGTPGATLRANTRDGWYEGPGVEGEWGWFRLLERARLSSDGPGRFTASWTLAQEQKTLAVRYSLWPAGGTSPLGSPRSFFRVALPASLQ